MPIVVTCPHCQKAMKAPDGLAGKKVKCPQCASAVPVPAGGATAVKAAPGKAAPGKQASASSAAVTADAKARTKAPAAAPVSAKKAPSLPLKSFEELKVSGRFRTHIEKAIGDDDIVWLGRQDMGARQRQAKIGMYIGLVFCLLSPLALLILRIEGPADKKWLMPVIAFSVMGVILLLFGLPMLFMPFFVRKFANLRPVYVLTERRALAIENRFGVSAKVHEFTRDKLLKDMEVKVEDKDSGLGSIIMGYEVMQSAGTFKHSSKTMTSEDGSRKVTVEKFGRTGEHEMLIPIGFMNIENVKAVEAVVRQTLNVPAKRAVTK